MDWEKKYVPVGPAECISWQRVLWSFYFPRAIPLRSSHTLDISLACTFPLCPNGRR